MQVLGVLGSLYIVSCHSISIPLLPSITGLPLQAIELILFSQSAAAAAATVADDDDDNADDCVDEYDLAPAASVFVGFRNQYLPYQLVP